MLLPQLESLDHVLLALCIERWGGPQDVKGLLATLNLTEAREDGSDSSIDGDLLLQVH